MYAVTIVSCLGRVFFPIRTSHNDFWLYIVVVVLVVVVGVVVVIVPVAV